MRTSLQPGLTYSHSYEVPAITLWPIDKAFTAYADWVNEEG